MPPKQRQIRVESKSALGAMQALESRSDEELEAETRYRAAAQAQERLQLRRMAEASLALAERRAGDLKVAAEKLGQAPPSNRQLLLLRFMGLIAPPPGSNPLLRVRGVLIVIFLIVAVLAIGWGLVQLVALPFGGLDPAISIFWGLLLVLVVLGVLFFVGRRRQAKARAKAAEQRANALGTGRAARRSGGGK